MDGCQFRFGLSYGGPKFICVLKRVGTYLSEDLTIQLHNAMVLLLFDYWDTIYGIIDHKSLSKLQQLQNRGAKTIFRVPKDTPTQSVKWSQMVTTYAMPKSHCQECSPNLAKCKKIEIRAHPSSSKGQIIFFSVGHGSFSIKIRK